MANVNVMLLSCETRGMLVRRHLNAVREKKNTSRFTVWNIIVILHFVECNIIFIIQWKMILHEVKPTRQNVIFTLLYTSCAILDPIWQNRYHRYQILSFEKLRNFEIFLNSLKILEKLWIFQTFKKIYIYILHGCMNDIHQLCCITYTCWSQDWIWPIVLEIAQEVYNNEKYCMIRITF